MIFEVPSKPVDSVTAVQQQGTSVLEKEVNAKRLYQDSVSCLYGACVGIWQAAKEMKG